MLPSKCAKLHLLLLFFSSSSCIPPFVYHLMISERHTVRKEKIWHMLKKKKRWRKRISVPTLFPSTIILSVCHSYLWEIRLETVTEKRGGAKSGKWIASLPLFLCSSSSSPSFSFSLSHAQACHSSKLSHYFSLYLPFVSCCLFIFSGLSFASTVLSSSPSPSLSELSVQTVEYMLSKYTSPLSRHLNKLQQGERKREAVGQEGMRMGVHRGDEAWKTEIFK